mmetsp:Transcript_91711/g.259598  ORF Transcript_91711/g.259598 Transcript_91711/m.259598 type:complete len:164 (+) Transcript_91711:105-596(+)
MAAKKQATDDAKVEQMRSQALAAHAQSTLTSPRLWRAVNGDGKLRVKLSALARTLIGLIAIYNFIWASVIAVVLAAVRPSMARFCLRVADTTLSGFWAGLPKWLRPVLPFAAVVLLYFLPNFPFLAWLGQPIAAKLAGELFVRNYAKEERQAKLESDGAEVSD